MSQIVQKIVFVAVASVISTGALATTGNSPSVFANDNLGKVSTNSNASPTATLPTSAKPQIANLNPVPPTLNVNGYFLEDVYSGKELASQNPDKKMEPASLTKLMTLYLTFEALQAGKIHMTDLVPVSTNAWKTGGSRMFIKVGDKVPVSDLINGVIVDSGNDACVALAEYIGGTEDGFVNLMNQQANLLGMKNTHYMDCTGLPNPNHYTTPYDMTMLSNAIINNFQNYYPLFAQKNFTYNHITQPNRNRLLWRDPSVDGLKTGHTDEAGYCLIASAKKNDMRLLAVVLGAPTDEARAEYTENLLNYGYRFYESHKVYSGNQSIQKIPVYFGKTNTLPIGVANDFYISVPQGQYQKVNISMQVHTPAKAPIKQGQKIGAVTATLNGKQIASSDLITLENVQQANIFSRIVDRIKLAFSKA
jgi:D-alanyl-D-alanine carboxypeptidase (penicillin-binding protein 5/6)